MSFIFCDADTKQIIDIVEDRRLSSLQAYFKGSLSTGVGEEILYL